MTTIAVWVALSQFVAPSAPSQSLLRIVDTPASIEERQKLQRYFANASRFGIENIFELEFEGFKIFRIQGKQSCLGAKCLTIVIRPCPEDVCQHVELLAEATVYSNPLYFELFEGLRGITFGTPGKAGVVLLYGGSVMLVTSSQ